MMMYVLGNKRGQYLRQDNLTHKYCIVSNIGLATVFDNITSATNVLKSSISKKMRSDFHVCTYEMKKENATKCISKAIELYKDNPEPEITADNWTQDVDYIKGVANKANKRIEELSKQHSDIEAEITDLYHYIEFTNLNAYQGYLCYKELQHKLRKRRDIKNELQVLQQLRGCGVEPEKIAEIQNTLATNKVYRPRILTELFEVRDFK